MLEKHKYEIRENGSITSTYSVFPIKNLPMLRLRGIVSHEKKPSKWTKTEGYLFKTVSISVAYIKRFTLFAGIGSSNKIPWVDKFCYTQIFFLRISYWGFCSFICLISRATNFYRMCYSTSTCSHVANTCFRTRYSYCW